jgi:hypothetical protein
MLIYFFFNHKNLLISHTHGTKTHYKHPTIRCQKTSQKTQNISHKTAKPQQQKTETEPATIAEQPSTKLCFS